MRRDEASYYLLYVLDGEQAFNRKPVPNQHMYMFTSESHALQFVKNRKEHQSDETYLLQRIEGRII
jgi:hypothetical protein